MGKRMMAALAISLLIVVTVFVASPLFALLHLRAALEARDPVAVKPLVDFPTLRANLKTSTEEKIEKKNDGTFLEPLKNWIGKNLAEGVLDKVATPEGLIRLTCDKKTDADLSGTRGQPCVLRGMTRDLRYQSYNRFRIDVTESDGKHLALVFARRGLTQWRLVNVLDTGAGT